MRDVALCFFGITRSLKYTKESIKKNMIDILEKNGFKVDIFMHTYQIKGAYRNYRAKEFTNEIDNEEYKLLKVDHLQIDDQDEIKIKLNLKQYRSHPDPWKSNYNSVDNFILAQYSKYQLKQLIHQSGNNYDYIIFIRPDCMYNQEFDPSFLIDANDNAICIPNFHCYGKYKFNDIIVSNYFLMVIESN